MDIRGVGKLNRITVDDKRRANFTDSQQSEMSSSGISDGLTGIPMSSSNRWKFCEGGGGVVKEQLWFNSFVDEESFSFRVWIWV